MATMYRYGTASTYEEIERTNSNYAVNRTTRKLTNGTNRSVYWTVQPGDQIRINLYTSNSKNVREVPASGSLTTNEWFFGSVISYTTGQTLTPVGATWDSDVNKYVATIPSGHHVFIITTAGTNGFTNNYVMGTVEKYVKGRGWVPVEPFIYDTNNGWGTGNTHEATNNTWS